MWLRRVDIMTRYANPDLLRYLAHCGDKGAETPEIADRLKINRSQATRILNSLEKAGLVRSVRAADLGRSPRTATRWFIRRSAVAKVVEDLRAYVLDEPR